MITANGYSKADDVKKCPEMKMGLERIYEIIKNNGKIKMVS